MIRVVYKLYSPEAYEVNEELIVYESINSLRTGAKAWMNFFGVDNVDILFEDGHLKIQELRVIE
jgi:hypothetical protein